MGSEIKSFRDTRKAAGLKLAEVAEKAGLSTSMVSMVENGLRPSPKTGRKLAAVFGRDPGEFWEGL